MSHLISNDRVCRAAPLAHKEYTSVRRPSPMTRPYPLPPRGLVDAPGVPGPGPQDRLPCPGQAPHIWPAHYLQVHYTPQVAGWTNLI